MAGISSLCRTCMGQINNNNEEETDGYNIFETEGLAGKLVQCSGLDIQPFDEYPAMVCDTCCMNILDFCDFQEMCRESLQKFQKLLKENSRVDCENNVEEILGDAVDAKYKEILEDIIEIKSEDDSEDTDLNDPSNGSKECHIVETVKIARLWPLANRSNSNASCQEKTVEGGNSEDVQGKDGRHYTQNDGNNGIDGSNCHKNGSKDVDHLSGKSGYPVFRAIKIVRVDSLAESSHSKEKSANPTMANKSIAHDRPHQNECVISNGQDDNQFCRDNEKIVEELADETEFIDDQVDCGGSQDDDDSNNSEPVECRGDSEVGNNCELDDKGNEYALGDVNDILEINLNNETISDGKATSALDGQKNSQGSFTEHFSIDIMDPEHDKNQYAEILSSKNDHDYTYLDIPKNVKTDKNLKKDSLDRKEETKIDDIYEDEVLMDGRLENKEEHVFEDLSDDEEDGRSPLNNNSFEEELDDVRIFGDPSEDEEILSDTDQISSDSETYPTDNFQCNMCPQTFILRHDLDAHKLIHEGLRAYPCTRANCQRSYDCLSDLKEHLNEHDGIAHDSDSSTTASKFLQCDLCPQTFKLPHRLEAHKRRHQGLPGYYCTRENCGRAYVRMSDLQQHLNDHDGIPRKILKCGFADCGQEYTTRCGYKLHLRKCHNVGPKIKKQLYVCEKCGATLTSAASLRNHSLSHLDRSQWPFVCDVEGCSKRMLTLGAFRIHKRRHAGIKPYVCPHCDKSFCTSTNLKAHVNYHTWEKTWTCHICAKVFATPASLRHHIQNVHERNPDRRFPCRFCDKTLSTRSTRKNHEMIHIGDKLFVCDKCGRKFTFYTALRKHERTHMEGGVCKVFKKFNCALCERAFPSLSVLKIHERKHTGERPYKCEDCGAKFRYQGGLIKHRKTRVCKKDKNIYEDYTSKGVIIEECRLEITVVKEIPEVDMK